MTTRILLVEDEAAIALGIVDRLRSEGYEVSHVESGSQALAAFQKAPFDLLLLDLMLPGKSGFEVCQALRSEGATIPILMLTARSQMVDKVHGLRIGADDYLTKPFEMVELIARVEALLRRSAFAAPAHDPSQQFGEIEIDQRSGEVRRSGEVLALSALEYKLLCHFADHAGELLSREKLLDEVWGYEATPFTRTVDQHIASLRKKIELEPTRPKLIVTAHGLGYRFMGHRKSS